MPAIGAMARRARPPAIGGLLLGAALLLGPPRPAEAQQASTPTATSLPRPSQPHAGLPAVLPAPEAARLRRIFQALARGDLVTAEQDAERLEERRLLGHVTAEAWSRPGTPPPGPEALRAWLEAYRDHPEAPAMLERLAARLPDDPPAGAPMPGAAPAPGEPPAPRNPALERSLRERARQGDAEAALAQVGRLRGLPQAQSARLRGAVALGLFQAARDAEALRLAAEASDAAPGEAEVAFTAGLAAWGLGRWDTAGGHFARAARAETSDAGLRAAAAFWAARAAVRAHRPALHVPFLLQAAQEPRTFYGMVARRALGLPPGFAWTRDVLGQAEAAALAGTPGGWRALALLQIGQPARAEAELRLLWTRMAGDPTLARAIMAVAGQVGMPALAALAGPSRDTPGEDGRPRDFARYPLPALRPAGGFLVDPALLYGIALQESRFEIAAISPAGARGLMQIMPATASSVANDPALRDDDAWRLHDPLLSMELGQRYLLMLARSEAIGGDLIRVLAAYNAGPGNLARWQPAQRHRDDPFLFIEAIPIEETRDYVRQVLAHAWAYSSRLGLPAPSLDALAAGRFPEFVTVEALAAMLGPAPRVPAVRPPRATPPAAARVVPVKAPARKVVPPPAARLAKG